MKIRRIIVVLWSLLGVALSVQLYAILPESFYLFGTEFVTAKGALPMEMSDYGAFLVGMMSYTMVWAGEATRKMRIFGKLLEDLPLQFAVFMMILAITFVVSLNSSLTALVNSWVLNTPDQFLLAFIAGTLLLFVFDSAYYIKPLYPGSGD